MAVPYVFDLPNEAICHTIVNTHGHMVRSAFGSWKWRLASNKKVRLLRTTRASIVHLFLHHPSRSKKSKVRVW